MALPPATSFAFPQHPSAYAKAPAPSVAEWQQLWAAWDLVTRQMIPEKKLLSKPIHLRNCCLFYLGHIPGFFDLKLTRGTHEPLTAPAHFATLFERGIDPDVEDPSKCHAHSEIPVKWPPLELILQYQQDVRQRVLDLYARGRVAADRCVARTMWLGMEHEAMHLETFLYMLLQSDWMVPPPGPRPDFAAIATEARAKRSKTTEWVTIPEQTVTHGLDDPENDKGPDRFYGWDIEKPVRTERVAAFQASPGPITNGEYAAYLAATGSTQWPASWTVDASNGAYANGTNGTNQVNGAHTNGTSTHGAHANDTYTNGSASTHDAFLAGTFVRTVYGPVSLHDAADWPVWASYDELFGCARWLGGRIPTLAEAQSIYAYVDAPDAKVNERAETIPAVNGHLSNNGVDQTPPFAASPPPPPRALFASLEASNTGFRTFHPLPPSLLTAGPAGRGGLGGVWEWTATPLAAHAGYGPAPAYPAYSADFFDGKHNVVLGGSWATHPRLAGRKSFVNWFQRSYPYAWVGARVVRDFEAE